jgi:hypothetical protein
LGRTRLKAVVAVPGSTIYAAPRGRAGVCSQAPSPGATCCAGGIICAVAASMPGAARPQGRIHGFVLVVAPRLRGGGEARRLGAAAPCRPGAGARSSRTFLARISPAQHPLWIKYDINARRLHSIGAPTHSSGSLVAACGVRRHSLLNANAAAAPGAPCAAAGAGLACENGRPGGSRRAVSACAGRALAWSLRPEEELVAARPAGISGCVPGGFGQGGFEQLVLRVRERRQGLGVGDDVTHREVNA